jgi:hypothetical protein
MWQSSDIWEQLLQVKTYEQRNNGTFSKLFNNISEQVITTAVGLFLLDIR